MSDAAIRALERAYRNNPEDSEARRAWEDARIRAGLRLPRRDYAKQRERLMALFSEWSCDDRTVPECLGAAGRRGLQDTHWAEGYAGKSADKTPHGIIAANWNQERDYQTGETVHTALSWLGEMFEKLPASERPEMDWSDTTSLCGGCNLLIDTEYHDGYMLTDGDILCQDCCLDDLESVIGYNASDRTIARELDRAPGWFQAAWREHKRAERDEEQGFTLEGQDTRDCERCKGKGKTSWRLTGGGMSNEHRCYDCNGSGQVDIETGEAA